MNRWNLAVALTTAGALTLLTGCTGTTKDSGQEAGQATVSITGASVVLQPKGDPFITMNLTTSANDRLTAAEVDPETVASGIVLTEPAPAPSAEAEPGPFVPGTTIDAVGLEGGKETSFGPGGYGMWLSKPKKLKEGSTVTITLTLEDSGKLTVQAPVR